MSSEATTSFRSVLEALEKYGLLLESDAQLPSLVGIVAGGPVRGSWWGHARGNIIFEVGSQLANHPDVLVLNELSQESPAFTPLEEWRDAVWETVCEAWAWLGGTMHRYHW